MAFSFELISQSMGQQTAAKEADLRSFTTSMDPNSSADLIQFQQKIQEWGIITNLQSTTLKTLKDALSSIVQKIQ